MSYKTGGYKAKYEEPFCEYSGIQYYTIYTALESVSDYDVYKMFDNKGVEHRMIIGEEDSCVSGCQSLIDVLYHLKHYGPGTYGDDKYYQIVIEEMTHEEVKEIFDKRL